MNIEDLEKGLETCRMAAEELLGFTTISNTHRTVTLSPEDRSALKGKGRLIFDLSIMETKVVRHYGSTPAGVRATTANEQIKEEFCLMITLNDERNSAIFLYGITTGLGIFKRFGEWVNNVLDHKVEMPKDLEVELIRTLRRGIVSTLPLKLNLETLARFLGRTPADVVRQYDTRSDDSGTTSGQTAFSE